MSRIKLYVYVYMVLDI